VTITNISAVTAAYQSLMNAIEALEHAEGSLRIGCAERDPSEAISEITIMVKCSVVALVDEINRATRPAAPRKADA
jgi:predicted S18 family serine protease